jgi:hypothetical protein
VFNEFEDAEPENSPQAPEDLRLPPAPAHLDAHSVELRTLCIDAYLCYQRGRGLQSVRYPPIRLAVEDGVRARRGQGKPSTPVWVTLGEFLGKNRLPARAFIQAQYAEVHGEPPLSTHQFIGEKALECYQRYRVRSLRDCQLELVIQTRFLKFELYRRESLAETDPLAAALADESLPLSSLFRFCVASHAGLMETAAEWQNAANEQYLTNPEQYREAWGSACRSRADDGRLWRIPAASAGGL